MRNAGARRARFIPLAALAVVAVAVLGAPARGDLIYFAEGGEARLPAEVDGDRVRLIAPGGPVEFRREDFRAIVPGHWPEHEWPALRDRAEAGDAAERYRAAWWALQRGLTPEAVDMLRSAHAADPSLEPVARLVSALDRLDRPAPSPNLAALRKILPPAHSLSENARFVLIHQHEEAEAAERLDLLDRVLTTFYLTYEALGFDLRPPSEKLVAVWFAEEKDYLAYIRKEAGEAFLSTRGYYHPTRGVVFFYDGRSRADFRRSMDGLRGRLDELDRAGLALEAVPPGARYRLSLAGDRPRVLGREEAAARVDRLARETRRDLLLQELDRLRLDQGAAVHEVVHQVVVASGLAPRYDAFPIWLHEGLAMQFEAVRGGRWAGPGEIPGHRLDQWRTLRSAPAVEPLLRDEGFGRGYAPGRYAAAWALVHHLRTSDPAGFVAFLDRLRNPRSLAGDRVVPAFRESFGGDPEAFRRRWDEDLRGLATPLEANAPPRPPGGGGAP